MSKVNYEALDLLTSIRGKNQSKENRELLSAELAEILLLEAKKNETQQEKKNEFIYYKILNNLRSKAFLISLGDQIFRSSSDKKTADLISHLIAHFKIPRPLSFKIKFKLWLAKTLGESFPSIVIPYIKKDLLFHLSQYVVPAEKEAINHKLEHIQNLGFRSIMHRVGEVAIGEHLAEKRLAAYLNDLENPLVDRISIDLAAIVYLKSLLNWEEELKKGAEKLRTIFRQAMSNFSKNGFKWIYLLSSQYDWLEFTIDLFKKVLGEEEFLSFSAAISLQAYFPDSFAIQKELTAFAKERAQRGGAPIKIIITKGAFLGSEQVEASKNSLPQAPFTSKIETDANFKRMVEWGLKKERCEVANISIATHNIFDLSYSLILAAENETEPFIEIELFDKRIPYFQSVLKKIVKKPLVLLFAIVPLDNLNAAIAYMLRRWDEYSGQDNFLKHIYELNIDSKYLDEQKQIFYQSCQEMNNLSSTPRRLDLRKEKPFSLFENEPPFDFSLKENLKKAQKIVDKWKNKSAPSIAFLNKEEIDRMVSAAEEGQKIFFKDLAFRGELLLKAAEKLRELKEDLIGMIMLDTKKTFVSADLEVNRAIDSFEYYYHRLVSLQSFNDIEWSAKGVVLSICSSRMPCASPSSVIAASVAMGNSTIVISNSNALATGKFLIELLWGVGFPKELLFFMPIAKENLDSLLLDKRVSHTVYCGYSKEVKRFLQVNPLLSLSAYCEGKNSFIISALCDRELAAKDLISSAFLSSATQKVSAISLGIIEAEVYDDPSFMKMVKDIASSLHVGLHWDLYTDVGPIGRAADEKLFKAFQLDQKEEWLLPPKPHTASDLLWSPIIKTNVQPGSFFHKEAVAGPILGLMRAKNLEHAIDLANDTPYGLLSVLHSLDPREHALFLDRIETGNCLINRDTNNIMISRQPIGGLKESSFGSIFQIGGPNFLNLFANKTQVGLPKEKLPVNDIVNHLTHFVGKLDLSAAELGLWFSSVANYAYWWKKLKLEKDEAKVVGQDNFLKYVPKKQVTLRIDRHSSILDALRVAAATFTCNTPLEISWERLVDYPWIELLPVFSLVEEGEEGLIERIKTKEIQELRLLSSAKETIKKASPECRVIDSLVLANGRFELLNYIREVSISIEYHRYGNLGIREGELRKMPL